MLVATALTACGEVAQLPISAGVGAHPQLPLPTSTLIPTVNIAQAVYQWKAGGSAGDDRKRLCQRTRYYALGSHTVSPGLVFSKSVAWPAPFDNGVFIGQHGSCERGPAGSGDRKDGP